MRLIGAALLLLLAAVCELVAIGALAKLWADYQDSPKLTYISVGLPPLVFGIVLIAAAVRLLRRRV
jgi:chromate transport protein ChrA